MWQSGFILGRKADTLWFLALPYLALATAFGCQQWLSAVAMASISLWITIPHHFATWVRAYGIAEDRQRWKMQLIAGPLVIFGMAMIGLKWAPLTVLLVAILWDKQHALMQQHGFARIYDFKAKTGSPSTARFDLALNWIFFSNLFLTSPFFTPIWLRELYRLQVPISADAVRVIQHISWSVTAFYLLIYLSHLWSSVRCGYRINPVKYIFLSSSYFVWYFTAWQVSSALQYSISVQIMHGVQYIVISYYYTRHRMRRSGDPESWAAFLVRPGNLKIFLMAGVFYAAVYQVIVGQSLEEFGFGVLHLQHQYSKPIRHLAIEPMQLDAAFDLFSASIVELTSLTHFYFDSFIWKVSDPKTREGL